jgi:ferritin-like protein
MAGSSAELHEDESRLQPATIDRHRAIVSIMEELEAVDWYDQRVDGTDDPELAEILRHNRDEEKEHAVMTLEWLRRHDPVLDQHLRHFLFTDGPILEAEEELTGAGPATAGPSATAPSPSLGIGSMRGKEEL